MIEALLLLIISLMILKLTAVWFIWKRMDQFQEQFDRMERGIDSAVNVANSPLWFRKALSVNVNQQQEDTSE